MKRSLIVITALAVVGLVLGGYSLLGHSGTAKAAGPITITMASIPGAANSGVSGSVTIMDLGGAGSPVIGQENVNGLLPFEANFPTVFYFTNSDCLQNPDGSGLAGIGIYDAGYPDQNAFLIEGEGLAGVTGSGGNLQLGDLAGGHPIAVIDTVTRGAYTGGVAGIKSVGVSTLPGYLDYVNAGANGQGNYNTLARVQHLACGDVTGSVSSWGGALDSTWRIPTAPCDLNQDYVCNAGDVHLELDMDVSDGNPCNPVDASATHMVGDTYKVAVCLTSAGVSDNGKNGPPASFQFDLDYDKTLNQCIDPAVLCTDDASTDAHCLDGDPDVNAGTTTFGGTSLGAGWDCTASQTTRPYCDTGNGTGNEAIAQAVCYTTKTPTLATGDTVSSAIAEVTFKALKVGTDTLALNNVTEGDAAGLEPIICPPSNQGDWVRCLNGTDIKAVPTATFTPTSTATPTVTNTPVPATATFTPTATFTSTPVPAGVRMQKLISPADTTNNGVLWVTKAGCWKIDPATGKPATDPITNQPIIDPTIAAANNGKGCLVIDEKIFGIHDLCNPNNVNAQGTPEAPGCSTPEGLGAWEHLLTFDHNFVYVQTSPDVGPHDWLTSGGRLVNSNAAGGCFVTIQNENSILEGCVTKDDPNNPGRLGPEGDGVVEQIYIGLNMTNIMTTANFRPTKDNGIQTVIDDHNCEVTDTQGEQIPGTLPGQLTTVCAPAYVTIRMLEGDLNLDCKVDVQDDQAIAFLYGATQGMAMYQSWYDLEPKWTDGDIDIKDLQFVFGRNYSSCANPSPNDQAIPIPPIDP